MLQSIPEDLSRDAWLAASWKQTWETAGPSRILRYIWDPGDGSPCCPAQLVLLGQDACRFENLRKSNTADSEHQFQSDCGAQAAYRGCSASSKCRYHRCEWSSRVLTNIDFPGGVFGLLTESSSQGADSGWSQ
ncbi:hypothetical protein AAFF_G00195190 [Aldrovandia affinis]|uniref:Uncharacterized protein n=1 Tax=Aldrovandia affinis TaxID=143900 RepID=A0AAD7SXM3_9TELE|nr:hypothetical protein AAFF_G00195190 [Aldrovandia affinis]